MKVRVEQGWLEVLQGRRLLFAIHPARRVMWRNRTKYTAIDFPWFKKEA